MYIPTSKKDFRTTSLLEQGKKKRSENEQFLNSRIAREFKIHNMTDAHWIALITALVHGEWAIKPILNAMNINGFTKDKINYFDIEKDFERCEILERHGSDYGRNFSNRFINEAARLTAELIEDSPARMQPLTKKPKPWTGPYREDVQLPLVSNITKKNLEKITLERYPDFYKAINRQQEIAYRVPPYLLPHLKNVILDVDKEIKDLETLLQDPTIRADYKIREPIKKEQRGLMFKKTQLLAQIQILHNLGKFSAIYFIVTADYRGRMYHRGGMVTPQGNDFCKAAFQFKHKKGLSYDT